MTKDIIGIDHSLEMQKIFSEFFYDSSRKFYQLRSVIIILSYIHNRNKPGLVTISRKMTTSFKCFSPQKSKSIYVNRRALSIKNCETFMCTFIQW